MIIEIFAIEFEKARIVLALSLSQSMINPFHVEQGASVNFGTV